MNKMTTGPMSGSEVEAPGVAIETAAVPAKRRWLRIALMLLVPALLLIGGAYYYVTSSRYAGTDNAQVQRDVVSISAQVSGPISRVFVRENQRVKAGDPLFQIDPGPYQVALEQAEGQLAAAQLQTHQLEVQAVGTSANIVGAEADLAINQRAFDRQAELLREGFTTRTAYDDALQSLKASQTALANARAQSANAYAAFVPSGTQPSVKQAQAAIDQARLNLSRTLVRAPDDGVVSNTGSLLVGQTVTPGIPMLSLVRSNRAWVVANFKEKELERMRVGQRATITVDAYGGEAFPAYVGSIGAGTGSEFSLIPAQNASGNWVKVTQWVPVRVYFQGTPSRPMIAGLSAEVKVDLESGR